MRRPRQHRRVRGAHTSRRHAALLSVAALIASAAVSSSFAPAGASSRVSATAVDGRPDQAGTYLVLLRSAPLATYDGGIPEFARTAPRGGKRFDADRPAVRAYEDHLLTEQNQLLSQLGSPPVLYRYTTALDGFAATLSSDQVASLRDHSDILAIERSRVEHVAGSREPGDRVHLPNGAAWQSPERSANAGKGIVIGVVDSGIWPENPSFAGVPLDRSLLRTAYPGFTGTCESGEHWSSSTCNAKVLAARYFLDGFGASHVAAAEYASPRDGSGHGSHTAAIAAGNAGVDVAIAKQHFGRVAGVAPAAGLAIYKACWAAPDPTDDGCATPDTAKAIDQAVRDGVDVLNYSVDDHGGELTDVVELAFLNAASAGVFIAAAAGDGGPSAGTVSHEGPWVTTVAASQTDRYQGAVVLGDGRRLTGAMVSDKSVGTAPLLYAGDVPSTTATRRQAARCLPGSLDASQVEGAIVVCDRGGNGRVAKSQTVSQAGGAAMVLVNVTHGSIEADLHAVPTVHLTKDDGARVRRYIAAATHPTARLDAEGEQQRPPSVADFSGRGPATGTGGDILKPDVTAPGSSVLAAVAPPSNFGHLWDLYSGTSMAAPAVSGLAAIVAAERPAWTPAMTKSAMMTTADRLGVITRPLEQGAGEVDPRALLDPGLVYDAREDDWLSYLRGSADGAAAHVPDSSVPPISPVDLNAASIGVGSLVGEETVTRTVTNVGHVRERFTAAVTGLHGVAVSVSRPSITLRPGQSASFDVTFSARKAARYDRFAHGTLTWTGSRGHVATSPIAVRPELVEAPAELAGLDPTGTLRLTARAGVTGTIQASSAGIVGTMPTGVVLHTGPFDTDAPHTDASTASDSYDVPDDAALARFEVHTPSPGDDLDLYVYRDGELVSSANDDGGDEQVTMTDPAAGHYTVYVHAASAAGDITLGSLTGWVIRDSARPAVADEVTEPLAVRPTPVTVTGGRSFALDVGWRHLDRSMRWLGVITYDGSSRRTFVTVN